MSSPDASERRLASLLARQWDLITPLDRKAALLAAYSFGAELAVEAHADGEHEACGDADDYHRVCVRFAAGAEECNDVEVELWRSLGDDPRYEAFRQGFVECMRERVLQWPPLCSS